MGWRWKIAHGVVSFDESGQLAQMFDQIKRSPDAAAGFLVEIITTATREKDGGEFHSIEGGRHPW
jgi:hypothetical protein